MKRLCSASTALGTSSIPVPDKRRADAESVLPLADDNTAQSDLLCRGLSARGEWIRGGMFARGLVHNLEEAIAFLIFNYTTPSVR
jgi:hypothetical protein